MSGGIWRDISKAASNFYPHTLNFRHRTSNFHHHTSNFPKSKHLVHCVTLHLMFVVQISGAVGEHLKAVITWFKAKQKRHSVTLLQIQIIFDCRTKNIFVILLSCWTSQYSHTEWFQSQNTQYSRLGLTSNNYRLPDTEYFGIHRLADVWTRRHIK